MLRARRPPLDGDVAQDLGNRQRAVGGGADPAVAWRELKKEERAKDEARGPCVIGTLRGALKGKCVYCETLDAKELDHHWPKAPHARHNQRRGTPAKMFVWENLVLACHGCNSWDCKGSHMKWCADGRTMLLNPFVDEDDPLCYFTIAATEGGPLDVGWIDLRDGLTGAALERARYTRERLKLNLREHLRMGRAATLRRFLDLVASWQRLGPDHLVRPQRTIRKIFLQILDPSEPHLGAIRQELRRNPSLRNALVAAMPELQTTLDAWDLPPFDCSKIT